jgi:hypothetical protein
MRILRVKADKLLPVRNNGGNMLSHDILRYPSARETAVQREVAVDSGETVFCGERGSGARGMKKKRGFCGHRR